MASYRLARPAREDISEILAYVAEDNLDAAISLSDRFEQTFAVLGRNPNAGRERPEINPGVGSFPMGAYLIFYRLHAGDLVIARVRHAAMDLTQELEGLN